MMGDVMTSKQSHSPLKAEQIEEISAGKSESDLPQAIKESLPDLKQQSDAKG